MTVADPKPYWMVHNSNGNPPKFVHSTQESAETEAKRIAELDPGHAVAVLGVVKVFCADRPEAKEVVAKPPAAEFEAGKSYRRRDSHIVKIMPVVGVFPYVFSASDGYFRTKHGCAKADGSYNHLDLIPGEVADPTLKVGDWVEVSGPLPRGAAHRYGKIASLSFFPKIEVHFVTVGTWFDQENVKKISFPPIRAGQIWRNRRGESVVIVSSALWSPDFAYAVHATGGYPVDHLGKSVKGAGTQDLVDLIKGVA